MTEIPQELAQEMADVLRRINNSVPRYLLTLPHQIITPEVADSLRAAKRIEDRIPQPVDPDLLLARKVAAQYSSNPISISEGLWDNTAMVKSALAAIKLARAEGEGK